MLNVNDIKKAFSDPRALIGEGLWLLGNGFHFLGDQLDRIGAKFIYRK